MTAQSRALYAEPHMRRICDWVASHPMCSRGDIQAALGLQESTTTIYRWLKAAVTAGLLRTNGVTSAATYEPSEELRLEIIRRHLSSDAKSRPRVGYHPEWLEDYVPNETQYLSKESLTRLSSRCPPGSAPLRDLDEHDVSMFMCDLSYASSRLEGNDYDYASTIQLAEYHIEKTGGSARDKTMILNHRDAVRFCIDSLRDDVGQSMMRFGINEMTIRGIHSILSRDLLKDRAMSGQLRTSHVEIGESSYIPPDIKAHIATIFERICQKAAAIDNPFEQSFFLSVHLPYLQPFEDCNKRTARVVCNIPLLSKGVTPISWMDVTMRPREYSDAVVAMYELNDTRLMETVFVECFLRSAERFSLLQRQKNPDPVAAKYRQEIKASIRARLLEGVEEVPPSVAMDDLSEFLAYVDSELDGMKINDMLGVRYGIMPHAVSAWRESQAQQEPAANGIEAGFDYQVETDDASFAPAAAMRMKG